MFAQNDFYNIITGASTSGNGRAPQGGAAINRGVWIITAAEMASAGFVNGDVLSGIGFTYSTAQNISTTGTALFYMQNTADATNTKNTTWATAITGMTTVSNGAITVPNTLGEFNYSFTGGTSFTYTGGGLYIGFDYQNLTNPLATTTNVALCNTALTNGFKGAFTTTMTPPTTITASNFRPETRLAIPVACSRPTSVKFDAGTSTLISANVSWNPAGGADVDIEYGPSGFALGTGTSFTNVSSPYTISGLSDSSVYSFYVRTNCGSGVYSDWNGPYSFNTTFIPTIPTYATGFEQSNLGFIGWSSPNPAPVAGDWVLGNYGPGALVYAGNYSATSVTPTTPANNWMFSRGINLTAGSSVVVTMFMSNYQAGNTKLGNYQVTVGTSATIAAQTTVLGSDAAFTGAAFTQKTFNFTPPSTGVYYFGVRNQTTANTVGTHAILVDNFQVTETLSTSSFDSKTFSIYPNPVKNILNIISSNNEVINSVKITDINGRLVKIVNPNSTSKAIEVNDLANGIYLVEIASENGSVTKKFIKE